MPGAFRLQVLESRLLEEGIPAEVSEMGLDGLSPAGLTAAMDVMVAGSDLPIVLVDDVVSSAGGIDVGAVVEAAERATRKAT